VKKTILFNHYTESNNNDAFSKTPEKNDSIYDGDFNSIFDNHPDAIFTLDVCGNITNFNNSLENIVGYHPGNMPEKAAELFTHKHEIWNNHFQLALKRTVQHFKSILFLKNGERMDAEITFIPRFDHSKKVIGIFGIAKDMTSYAKNQQELHRFEQKIKHLAFHDQLTGIPNNRMFNEMIEKKISEGTSSLVLLLLNLNRFKTINNTLGRGIADQLLKLFSDRVNRFLDKGTFFARLSGDEFGIICWDESVKPYTIAKTILDQMKEPFQVQAYEIYLTASIGISHFPSDETSPEELLKSANVALSRAKELGKNSYQIYGTFIDLSSLKMYSLETDMYKAIQNEELFLHFQPRVAATTGKMVSAEALIRWQHPKYGIISPNDFIPLAEENGLILEIGDWVLQKVCFYIQKWKQNNIPIVPISINLSVQRFLKNDLIATIHDTIKKTQVDPAYLEIEITESTLIQHEEIVNATLESLKDDGIQVALDDFGTGYSSLTYLKKFPIDTIKIDQSFIKNIGKSQSDEIIIKSIIFLSKGLNKRVVAEGVETREQLLFLQQQGCDEIQGYYYSKPVSSKEFQAFLTKPVLNPSNASSSSFKF
jgi:diguanylate cyclase (GGDEF)-like protein/PAS domain S-box-containing protein